MRLLLVIAAASLIPGASAAAPPIPGKLDIPSLVPPPGTRCPQTSRYEAQRPGEPPRVRKLAELPPADTYAAVLRQVNGCNAPLVLSRGVRPR